ncbi:unnamed protein product [Rhizoctonia solani]|uniref:NACHT domain-containing protein n=1 Tax=Rhizoctonia solani TaxID=456999 RepID=A0A8H3C563_9AGAM|nr:unnamed protein product [Rhizoctonia solani]
MSTNNSPKPKSKGLRSFFRKTLGRPSSHLPPPSPSPRPSTSQVSVSSNSTTKAHVTTDRPSEQDVPQSKEGEIATRLTFAPPVLVTAAANSQPIPPPTDPPTVNSESHADKIAHAAWIGLQGSLESLKNTSGVFGPLAAAVGILLDCFDTIETAAKNQQDYEDLATELSALSEALTQHFKASASTPMSKCISGVSIGIKQQAEGIREKRDRGKGRRLLHAREDEDDIMGRYRRIQSLLRQLQANLNLSAWSIAHAHLANTRLEGLDPKKQAAYDSTLSTSINRRTCTEGTRKDILSGLIDWLRNSEAPKIYWMNGMAGTGKTTIACTFAEWLEKHKLLAASFFCTRTSVDCRDVTRIIPTIAYQLARYSIPFQSALYEILEEDPDAGTKHMPKQFERLLREPLQNIKGLDSMPDNLVIVIDALDECDSRNGVEALLDRLFRFAADIPLRFFVTSRPEPEIYRRMMLDVPSRAALHLHDIETSLVQSDIELYLKEELAFMAPNTAQIEQLVHRSGSLFIYAATLVRYIRFSQRFADPRQRLQSVLSLTLESTKKDAEIDALYAAILASALEEVNMEEVEVEDIKHVLRTVLFAQEPISVETIAVLAGLDNPERVSFALQPLRSVLHQSEVTGLVSTLHSSFPDFMFSHKRSGQYFYDVLEHSQAFAQKCFLLMKQQLRFNICDLESSFVADEKVKNIQDRIKDKISPSLAYVCRYWANHLKLAPQSDALLEVLDEFLSDRLLFWIEVLSLRREIAVGIDALFSIMQWLTKAGTTSSEQIVLVEDARNFVTGCAAGPASRSTPHIYISSLPLCPRSSSVYKLYWKRMRGLLELKSSLMEHREIAALATWNIGSKIYSVAYSPDGSRVAVGSYGTVSIRSAYDGTLLVGPLPGHADPVWSIAFSPDGRLLASGSVDYTIRVWNVFNGTLIAGPLKGHTGIVCCVSFSPDSTRIISGSYDNTIQICNASDGTLLLGPLQGHEDAVVSVTFSPDGALIASGSSDSTIRLWNSHDGTPAAAPFQGHTDIIESVAFTPDGTRLVSGSWDRTIRVWNTSDGSPCTGPFEGHTDSIFLVAISPDGTRVASCSDDRTVRVWNIENGKLVAGPFVGHTNRICSVAYSPDGTRIISGSEDGTFRVWNARDSVLSTHSEPDSADSGIDTAVPDADSTVPDTDSTASDTDSAVSAIESVVFSPDGLHIISSSDRSVVKIWDLSDGSFVTAPHKAQFFSPPLIDLSPDHSAIASISEEGMVQITSTADGSLVAGPFEIEHYLLSAFRFSHDGTTAIMGCDDGTIHLRALSNEQPAVNLFSGHDGTVTSISQSPDCSLLVSYSSEDKTMRVWNMLAPTIDLEFYSKSSSDSFSGPADLSVYDGWYVDEDGWLRNGDNHLLFWLPLDIGSLWKSPYASLIITELGTLRIPKQKLFVGDQWSRCYIHGHAREDGSSES